MAFGAMSFGAWLQAVLGGFGIKGQLAVLFIVFFVDAVLFPMLPEAFVVLFYNTIPTIDTRFGDRTDLVFTAVVILLVVLAAEMAANGFLYALVKWKGHKLPQRLTRAMNKWREFLILSDERVVLLNRVVPVMPFTGAFIAVSPWNPQKAMGYLALGGAVKYGGMIAIMAYAGTIFDPRQTWWISLALVLGILVVSVASHGLLRKRFKARAESAKGPAPMVAEAEEPR
jgi:membrane-associated protein